MRILGAASTVRRCFICCIWLFTLSLTVSIPSQAQELRADQKYLERLNPARSVVPIETAAFGENINLKDGAVQFNVTDIDIPGNSRLPVRLQRKFVVEDKEFTQVSDLGGFAIGGDFDVPYLWGVFSTQGWNVSGANPNNRCSAPSAPPTAQQVPAADYWSGNWLSLPGEGKKAMLAQPSPSLPWPTDGAAYPWVTKDLWVFKCAPSTKNGYPGESFVGISPTGDKYYFDWVISKPHTTLSKRIGNYSATAQVARVAVYFLVSRVEDPHGNWVNYEYANNVLKRISSSDGRFIEVTGLNSGRIASISSSVGVWRYTYTGSAMTKIMPDGSSASYSSAGRLVVEPTPSLPYFAYSETQPPRCPQPEGSSGSFSYTVTLPSGVTATYEFQVRRHFRHNIPKLCNAFLDALGPSTAYQYLTIPNFSDNLTLISKSLSGPGLPANLQWNYTYGIGGGALAFEENCANLPPGSLGCQKTIRTEVRGPSGDFKRYHFGAWYQLNEGQLLKVEEGQESGSAQSILRTITTDYVGNDTVGAMPFPASVGNDMVLYSDDISVAGLRPAKRVQIEQDGALFVHEVVDYDNLARPIRTSRYSPWHSRTDATEYYDHRARWVLGQEAKTTNINTGVVAARTEFDAARALPVRVYGPGTATLSGKLTQTLTYNVDGTVATVKDGNNNITTLSGWKRGIPQSIRYPATPEVPTGATQSAVVNDSGWITSVTDENGYKTCYGYDAMGRMSSVTYPSETATGVCDTSAWTSVAYNFVPTTAQFGIPAGHWAQVQTQGGYRKITHFDALWRPIFEQEEGGPGTVRYTRRTYDHEGRVTFEAYPVASASSINDLTKGIWTEYDALGRMTSMSQDSEQGLLVTTTAYLAGLLTRVTSPKGQQTTTSYMAYDQPTYDWPKAIVHPEGAFTDITRDVFGKPTALKRRNSAGSVAVTRSYAYNSYQELCRSVEPETGVTLMGYDGAGNLTWSASGLSPAAAPGCHSTGDQTSINPRKAVRTYDARNRVRTLSFSDGKGDQTWTYTPDGLPASIAVSNPNVSTPITNTYSYNRRRLLVSEATKISTPTYTLGYGYNANGHLSSMTYPNTTVVGLAPNALGQPTQAGSYATGVQYYPNGALKQFTYGNGIVHTMTQNARQLPARSTDSNGALDLGYAYDKNANVSAITDYTNGGRQTRAMSYDNLDRLTQTTSAMFGTASYGYNALDNLTSLQVTGGNHARNYGYVYDGGNRLTNITNGVGGASIIGLGYDDQGNVVNKNGQAYEFDYGNRLRRATNKEWYAYDGHGRRVLSCTPTACDYQQYAADGKLYFHQDNRNGLNYVNVYLGGSLVAIREQPTAGGAAVVKYQHTDALGTPIAETDANKAIIRKSEYEPYGQLVNRALTDGPGFTGHVQDAATGLTYMQQRYYDPMIGRFLSVDPVTAYGGNLRHFNRYAYAYNNPYKFTDQDGRLPDWVNLLFGKPVDSVGPRREMSESMADAVDRDTKGLQNAAAQLEKGRQAMGGAIEDRVSINAKFKASAGTGIQGNKSIAGNSSDTLGWVPVGEGAYAGLTIDINVVNFKIFDGDSPFTFEAGGDIGAGGSIGGAASLNPAGEVKINISLGVGLGEHVSYSPTMNVELNRPEEK